MKIFTISAIFLLYNIIYVHSIHYENDLTFKVDAGSRTCFFEKAEAGQTLEVQYQVIDGQHGDLDISFDIIDPDGTKILADFKKSQNSIIRQIDVNGSYVFCLDNTFSVLNSKTVFIYLLIEHPNESPDAEVSVVEGETEHKETLEWVGHYKNGDPYYLEVQFIAEVLTRILKHVVKARHFLDIYGALKAKDSHLAYEDTFIVDVWSGFQISFMMIIGLMQVFMIKKLFNRPVTRL